MTDKLIALTPAAFDKLTEDNAALKAEVERLRKKATLRERLSEGKDWDIAMYEIGVVLGVFKDDDFPACKGVLWTNNPLSALLTELTVKLVNRGVLLRDEEGDTFKWNVG